MTKIANSDYIIINVNNNGCGYIWLENNEYECSRENAEGMVRAARMNGYREVAWQRHENGDQTYWFN